MIRPCIILVICAVAICPNSRAREADGTLGLIRTPNNGMPAVVAPGETFQAVLTEQAELSIASSDASVALTAEWTALPGGAVQATCTVPPDAKPGLYALTATVGQDVNDTNVRSVYVQSAPAPEYYIVAHMADMRMATAQDNAQTASVDTLRKVVAAVNTSGAAFAVVTGNLTASGMPEQFQALLDILDTCTVPTFVCPGSLDAKHGHYQRYFGPLTYMFRFGPDGYISFDTKDTIPADELGPQDGDLYLFRRAIRSARWSVGFTHRYELLMGMRSQLVLFADDPLDGLIVGHAKEKAVCIPWGNTALTVTPPAADGYMRVFDVSAKGMKPREPQRVVLAEPPPVAEETP